MRRLISIAIACLALSTLLALGGCKSAGEKARSLCSESCSNTVDETWCSNVAGPCGTPERATRFNDCYSGCKQKPSCADECAKEVTGKK